LNALFQAVSEMYPEDRKVIVFQPHLFSRTRDFSEGFAKSLSQFDEIFLLDIYPARELPIEGVTSIWLKGMIADCLEKEGRNTSEVQLIEKPEIYNELRTSNCRIQLLVGAGDIGVEVEFITKSYTNES
jgi:UDP-N-acetylmuramate--alanine ligase